METIGYHVCKTYCKKKGATIEQNIEASMKKYDLPNLKTVQIFVASPLAFKFSVNGKEQEDSLKEFIKCTGMHIYAHARYLDNIFSTEVKPGTLGFVRKELKICSEVGILGFVVHLYKYPPNRVVESLITLNPPTDVKIMLETPAMKPDRNIYYMSQQLIDVWNATQKAKLNCGICIDTCHIFVSGINLTEPEVAKEYFTSLIKCIPPTDILIHLNDSATPLGSGRDRHASLGEGLIWGKNKDSLRWLVEFIKKYKIDAVNERTEGSGDLEIDFKTLRNI